MQGQRRRCDPLGQLNVTLAKDAQFKLFIANAGATLTRQELNIRVEGEGADFNCAALIFYLAASIVMSPWCGLFAGKHDL